MSDRDTKLALLVKGNCLETAKRAYQDAQISGLCHEGAWEAAVSALQMMDLDALTAAGDPPGVNVPGRQSTSTAGT